MLFSHLRTDPEAKITFVFENIKFKTGTGNEYDNGGKEIKTARGKGWNLVWDEVMFCPINRGFGSSEGWEVKINQI